MNKENNAINWFEIPATDLQRAKTFYQTIFGIDDMEEMEMMGNKMAFLPFEDGNGKVSGALVQGEGYKPTVDGALVYLNADPSMEAADKIESAGGKILMPKTHIGDNIGYMAVFIDSEGNRMALHSNG